MRPTLVLAALLATALVSSGTADHCEGWNGHQPEVDTGPTPAGRYYVDNDLCQPECLLSVWVYEESNNMEGLQRGDEVVDDTCHGMIASDTIIF